MAKQLILEDNKKKYYIGKIIVDTANINPSTYLGFGTWELWGSGKCPVGVLTTDTDFATVEKTGGSKTVTLTTNQIPSHTHTFTGNDTGSSGAHTHTLNGHTHSFSATTGNNSVGHTHSVGAHSHGLNSHTHTYAKANATSGSTTLTVDQIPSHTHSAPDRILVWDADGTIANTADGGYTNSLIKFKPWNWNMNKTGGGKGHTHSVSTTSTNSGAASGSTANSSAFNTGGISANHTHSVSGTTGANSSNTTSNGGHTHTTSGTNSNTGGGGSHNNLQPYITCYFWKRVA